MEPELSAELILEVCVDSVDSAIAAQRGGAHRIELCSNLLECGVTPSAGLIATVRSALSIELYVMIRPRGGDFYYSSDEVEIMERDIQVAKDRGANGIVLGALRVDGTVDVERTRHLVDVSAPLEVTFHRAFDMSADLFRSLRDVRDAGVRRVLTSGGKQTAAEGAEVLAGLVKAPGVVPAIIAASGINESNVSALIEKTGVRQVHATLRSMVPSQMRHQNGGVSMGGSMGMESMGMEYQRLVVDESKVRGLLRAALKARGLKLKVGQHLSLEPN
jgi:copper homeostasis protein